MANQFPPSSDITSDDRLFAALAYVFSPIVPIILLLMEDKKIVPSFGLIMPRRWL
jgi:hypothetical protein